MNAEGGAELVVHEVFSGSAREREAVACEGLKTNLVGQLCHHVKVNPVYVRHFGVETFLLRANQHDGAARPHVRHVRAKDGEASIFVDVFENVGNEESIERSGPSIGCFLELVDGEGLESTRSGDVDGRCVVVDAHGVTSQVVEVAADTAADLERRAHEVPAHIPGVGHLTHVGENWHPTPQGDEPLGVRLIAGIVRVRDARLPI